MTTAALRVSPLQFGAAHHPEYQPLLGLDRDLDLMQAANFNVVPNPVAAAWRCDTPVTVLSGVANGMRATSSTTGAGRPRTRRPRMASTT